MRPICPKNPLISCLIIVHLRVEKRAFGRITESCRRFTELDLKKVFDNLPTIRMVFVEEFGVELHTKQRTFGVLHCLDGTVFIGGGGLKTWGKFLHFVKVGMPNSDLGRQVFEDAVSRGFTLVSIGK